MLIDARLLPDGARLRADVVVVGSGPAGITVANALADAGVHVLLLEAAGRHHSAKDDDALDGSGSGEPFPLVPSRHRGFGGTSTHWTPATGLRVRRLDEIDFGASPARAGHSWPFGRAELERYYTRAYDSLDLDPDDAPGRWYGPAAPTTLTWPGGPALAMFQFADHDAFTRRFDDVRSHPRIDLVLHATACQLIPAAGSTVGEVSVRSGAGTVSAVGRCVVLACGAIENARLLLSSPGVDGRAIGNEHGLVGRYLMDHISTDVGFLVPERQHDINAALFAERQTAVSRHEPMLWLGAERIAAERTTNAAFWIGMTDPAYLSPGVSAARALRAAWHQRPRRDLARHATGSVRGIVGLARFAANKFARSRSLVPTLRILAEQVPNADSRIRLSSRRDAWDRPRVDVEWRVSRADLDGIETHRRLLATLLADRGVATLAPLEELGAGHSPIMTNYHHLGTTRMHADARHGVVDTECRVHTVPNLFVTGGSVFPTGGYLNPTLTILALAFRTADTIRREFQPVRVVATPR